MAANGSKSKSKYAEYYNVSKNTTTNSEGQTEISETFKCIQPGCPFTHVKKSGAPTNTVRTHLKNKHEAAFKILEAREIVNNLGKPVKAKAAPRPKKDTAGKSTTKGKKNAAASSTSTTNNEGTLPFAVKTEHDDSATLPNSSEQLQQMVTNSGDNEEQQLMFSDCPTSPQAMESLKRPASDDIAEHMKDELDGSTLPDGSEPMTVVGVFGAFFTRRMNMLSQKKRGQLEIDILSLLNRADYDGASQCNMSVTSMSTIMPPDNDDGAANENAVPPATSDDSAMLTIWSKEEQQKDDDATTQSLPMPLPIDALTPIIAEPTNQPLPINTLMPITAEPTNQPMPIDALTPITAEPTKQPLSVVSPSPNKEQPKLMDLTNFFNNV